MTDDRTARIRLQRAALVGGPLDGEVREFYDYVPEELTFLATETINWDPNPTAAAPARRYLRYARTGRTLPNPYGGWLRTQVYEFVDPGEQT